jgi:uncharacterized protein (TIGR03437 family)
MRRYLCYVGLVVPLFGQGLTVTTVAGDGVLGFAGDNGPALNSEIWAIAGIAVDNAGNIYFSDTGNSRVRKVNAATGIITTIAGNSIRGYSGDGGPATSASLQFPHGIAVDGNGNVYIGDGNQVLRKVDTNGMITTIAGTSIYGYSGDGGLATKAQVSLVTGIVVDPAGNIIFSDADNHAIRKITPLGIISTIAGTGTAGHTGDGGPALAATLNLPNSVAFDAAGNLYITEPGNNDVRMITPQGIISTVAGSTKLGHGGDGGLAINALFNDPQGSIVDQAGNLYITDEDSQLIRIVAPNGIINTIAGTGTKGFSGDGGPSVDAQVFLPEGIALAPNGTIYFVDSGNNRIRALVPPPVTALPSIKTGGVISASAFGALPAISPGGWIEIYGSNLAVQTNSWAGVNFTGTAAPTSLIGTSVTIGGAPAFIEYVSATQINAQVPSGVATGPQQLIVKTPAGSTAAYTVTVNAAEPGLLAPPSFNVGGTQYVVALFPDQSTYVLPPGAIPGVTSKRAQPGDVLTIYGVGFGAVTPAISAGQVVSEANSIPGFQMMFGSTPATTQYAGLAPSAIGLYQFNVVVPNVPASDTTPLSFSLAGVPGTQTLFIAIQ